MRFELLDHGYVELVQSWGSDQSIIEAARMSTDKGFKGWGTSEVPGDEKLLRFLWEHKHLTPFEMAGLTLEIQAPIMVFREWHRHRTQSYNEMSGRYIKLPNLCYIPSIERIMAGKQATTNKQGSQEGFSEDDAFRLRGEYVYTYERARRGYERLLKQGVARELARLVLPVAQYSRMRASANLRNWLGFLELRLGEGAQWEIRQYAGVIASIIKQIYPRTALLALGETIVPDLTWDMGQKENGS